ncbi:MAG: hydrolase [Bdellovibrio sp.]|nr:hydrolase [Bdellovibrio sp.]
MNSEKFYPCPCCSYLTLTESPPGTFEICPVCFWEDDRIQYDDPNFLGGANDMSLNTARKNFIKYGAISKEAQEHVRKPLPDEYPSRRNKQDEST